MLRSFSEHMFSDIAISGTLVIARPALQRRHLAQHALHNSVAMRFRDEVSPGLRLQNVGCQHRRRACKLSGVIMSRAASHQLSAMVSRAFSLKTSVFFAGLGCSAATSSSMRSLWPRGFAVRNQVLQYVFTGSLRPGSRKPFFHAICN